MESALYHPERGFYARRVPKADFYTAPELHPAFAAVLARHLAGRLAPGESVVEMGSGAGVLAAQLRERLPAGTRYVMIERSAAARAAAAALNPGAEILSSLEELAPFSGVFLSNELVDAFPVHLLEKRNGELLEVFVADDGSEVLRPLSRPELAVNVELQEGERHAVNLEAALWLKRVASVMTAGTVITVDYGKRFGAMPNPPRAYRAHAVHQGLTEAEGRQDLTASVDFDQLIAAGDAVGLSTESYTTLSRFLLDGGIGDFMPQDYKGRMQVKTLVHPDGMGEVFKVLIQSKRGGFLA